MSNNSKTIIPEYDEYEKFQVEFAKAISTPEYRKFCNDNKLDFHFWDLIPEDQFDPAIARKETRLHWNTRILFNKTKAKYTVYNNQIIDYYFDEWVEPSFSEIFELEEFVKKYVKLENKYEKTSALYSYTIELSPFIYFVWMIVLYFYFTRLNMQTHYLIDLLMLVIPIIITSYLPKFLLRRRIKRKDKKFKNEINSEFEFIRNQLRHQE